MNKLSRIRGGRSRWCCLWLILWGLPVTLSAKPYSQGEVVFALEVKALLEQKCLACHGGEDGKIKGDLDMRGREVLLRGGESSSQVLVPGDAEGSLLYIAASWKDPEYEMPPKEADRLSEEELAKLAEWINEGAPWPEDERVEKIRDELGEDKMWPTSGGLSEEWTKRRYKKEDLWAYQPLQKTTIPQEYQGNAIDYFIAQGLEKVGLSPAPEARSEEVVRRLSFNLTGLPPQPEDVSKPYAQLVEEYLASPHYGEQMARHWLDVVRYADSGGFANDWERPHAWRYRDYVVRAFQEDKPYDTFVMEQLAGDEMDAQDVEKLIATGFLRMGPWEQTGMTVAKVSRQQWLDDVTDSVGQVFMAHALQCARCHDHKFDPVPTRDYYRIQAVFATTQFAERKAPFLEEENVQDFEVDRELLLLQEQANLERVARLEEKAQARVQAFFAEKNLPYKTFQEAKKAGLKPEELPVGKGLMSPDDLGSQRISKKWKTRYAWEKDRHQPFAYSVYNGKSLLPKNVSERLPMPKNPMGKGVLEETSILGGGDVFSPTDKVKPGVLSAAHGDAEQATLVTEVSGRRLALAKWLVDQKNPLTARVMVNRIWQWHFGQGLAGNANSFGATGKKPTHPELLDYLAAYFMDSGWSVKAVHRLILDSALYRRSSNHPDMARVEEKDPLRTLYAHVLPRRLAAEEFRDAMLSISGELNPQVGGIPARPDINMEVALQPRMIMGTFAPAYQAHPTAEMRNRRTLYALKWRGLRDPFLETFNQPGSEASCELRDASTVTPQVFSLFNGQEVHDRALAAANTLIHEESREDAEVVRALYLKVFQRMPEKEEEAWCLQHWKEMWARHETLKPEAQKWPTSVLREAQEENTGKPFRFEEALRSAEHYQPDLQAHEVDAKTRALADLCLVLFNSNEFSYIY